MTPLNSPAAATIRSVLPLLVALPAAAFFASTAMALTASTETMLLDPYVPAETRKSAAASAVSGAAPSTGAVLQTEVQGKLKQTFDAAVVNTDGSLTAAQASAAGLGFVAKHFDQIDQRKLGAVRFEDVTRFLKARGAALPDR